MGRAGWLVTALIVLILATCVRFRRTYGGFFGEGWTVEFVLPWR